MAAVDSADHNVMKNRKPRTFSATRFRRDLLCKPLLGRDSDDSAMTTGQDDPLPTTEATQSPKKPEIQLRNHFSAAQLPTKENRRVPSLSFPSFLTTHPPVSFVVRFFLGFIISSINSDHVVRDGDVKVKDSKALVVISTTRKKKTTSGVVYTKWVSPNRLYTTSYFYY